MEVYDLCQGKVLHGKLETIKVVHLRREWIRKIVVIFAKSKQCPKGIDTKLEGYGVH